MLIATHLCAGAGLRHYPFDVSHAANAALHIKHKVTYLSRRKIAAGKDLYLGLTWFDAGEKFNALAVATVGSDDGDQHENAEDKHGNRHAYGQI